jgi:hypothetical protein
MKDWLQERRDNPSLLLKGDIFLIENDKKINQLGWGKIPGRNIINDKIALTIVDKLFNL